MKIKKILTVILVLILSTSISKAEYFLNFGEFFTTYFNTIGSDIPQSYKYIKLNFKNITQTGDLYLALQKGVYMDLLPNQNIDLNLEKKISQKQVSTLIKSNFGIDILYGSGQVTNDRLKYILLELKKNDFQKTNTQDQIMEHVYDTLQSNYLYPEYIKEKEMTYGAIQGMVASLNDPYTQFFSPDEAKEFNEDINGEFQGIGAYIEKNKKGEVIIVSPLKGSPAARAGIQAQDIITKIDNIDINIESKLSDVVKAIKGPKGTKVKLKIQRGDKELEFIIIREKIVVENIESKKLDNQYCYTAIHMFSMGINRDFDKNMKNFKDCNKYIFDVRNNPGGGLREVSNILGYFVPVGETTVYIEDRYGDENLKASNKPFKINKNIIILINGGSASASEIFAGTIKDYIPNTLLVGEKTFGKGSVQNLVDYTDGSMLKYTQAKRYTGKSKKNIDKEGINPDLKLQDNPDTEVDEILSKIENLNF